MIVLGPESKPTAWLAWESNRRSVAEQYSETASRARKQKAKLFDLWVEIPLGITNLRVQACLGLLNWMFANGYRTPVRGSDNQSDCAEKLLAFRESLQNIPQYSPRDHQAKTPR